MSRTCLQCRTAFKPLRENTFYCSSDCSKKADQIELTRARVLYRMLYWWRLDRNNAADLLRFICREIRDWHEQDLASQRLPPPRPTFSRDLGHQTRKRANVSHERSVAGAMREAFRRATGGVRRAA